MDVETFDWLLTPAGQALLAEAADEPGDPLAAASRLRGRAGAEQVAAALTTVSLRRRAAAKFGQDAARMFFTADALEQSTRSRVAEHRAARLVAAGADSVIDLGCGIGGDLIAVARAGITAAGVDLDPLRVRMARANLEALGLPGAVTVADAVEVDHRAFAVAFADPARRSARGRTFSVADWTPPWSFVEELLSRDACVKTAPGIDHQVVPAGVEAEWVSAGGEVKEAALWSGSLATTRHRATVIAGSGLATLASEDLIEPGTRSVGEFLFEPDGAVIRAGLVAAVIPRLGAAAGLLDSRIAYLTGDTPAATPFARAYRVVEELPYREKQLRAALRERDIGALTIKKRGVAVEPEALRRRLGLRGERTATIVLTRVAGSGTCLLVDPL